MRLAKIALTAAFVFGSLSYAAAQGAGGPGESPSNKSAQGAASSPRYANPAATANDTMERGGTGMSTHRHHRHHHHHHMM